MCIRDSDHSRPLGEQLAELEIPHIDYAAALTRTDLHFEPVVELLRPGGRIGVIDDPGPIDVTPMKWKSLSFHWEFMFTRPMFETPDIEAQRNLLDEVSTMLDGGQLRCTARRHFGEIDAVNLERALQFQAGGEAVGKSTLGG